MEGLTIYHDLILIPNYNYKNKFTLLNLILRGFYLVIANLAMKDIKGVFHIFKNNRARYL